MTFSEKFRDLRIGVAMTQEQLSEALGVSVSAVSQWELDLVTPRIQSVKIIADYFKVSPEWLLDATATEQYAATNISQALVEEFEKLPLSLRKSAFDFIRNLNKLLGSY